MNCWQVALLVVLVLVLVLLALVIWRRMRQAGRGFQWDGEPARIDGATYMQRSRDSWREDADGQVLRALVEAVADSAGSDESLSGGGGDFGGGGAGASWD